MRIIIRFNLFILLLLLPSLNAYSQESKPETIFKRQSYWSVGYNQFYNHRRSTYPSFGEDKLFKQQGYIGLIELTGILYPFNTGKNVTLYTGMKLSLGRGVNYDFDHDLTAPENENDFWNVYGNNAMEKHPDIVFHGDYIFGWESKRGTNYLTFSTGCEYRRNKVYHKPPEGRVSYTNSTTNRINIPFAAQMDNQFSDKLLIGLKLVLRFMVYGNYYGHSSRYSPGQYLYVKTNLPTSPLENMIGAGIEIPVWLKTPRKFDWKFTPWFNYRPYNEGIYDYYSHDPYPQETYEVRIFQAGLSVSIVIF